MPKPDQREYLVPNIPAGAANPARSLLMFQVRHSGLDAAGDDCAQGEAVDYYRVALFREAIAAGTYDLRPYRVAGSLMRLESSLEHGAERHLNHRTWAFGGDCASAGDLLDRMHQLFCAELEHLARDAQPTVPEKSAPAVSRIAAPAPGTITS